MPERPSEVKMINVGQKEKTLRAAIAEGTIKMTQETFKKCIDGVLPKGDVFSCARVAGIMAAKKTSSILPLCHPIQITSVEVDFDTSKKGQITVKTKVEGFDRTGVEMEALTATSVALLAIYDMCKTVDKNMLITCVALLEKSGGKSGAYKRPG